MFTSMSSPPTLPLPPTPAPHPGEEIPQLGKAPDHPPTPRHTGQLGSLATTSGGSKGVLSAVPGRRAGAGSRLGQRNGWIGMCRPTPTPTPKI